MTASYTIGVAFTKGAIPLINYIKSLVKPTIIFSIILVLFIIISYIVCRWIGFDPELLLDDLGTTESLSEQNPTKGELFIALFQNNILVPLQILLLALIPIPFVYTIVLLFNGILIGAVFYIYQMVQLTLGGDALYVIIFKDFLPHAVIELLGFIIATAIASRINQWLFRKIIYQFRKENKREIPYGIRSLFVYSSYTFIIIILPLIVIAAMIEAYITPLI